MIATVCSDVPDGYEHWTLRLLVSKLIELSIFGRRLKQHIADESILEKEILVIVPSEMRFTQLLFGIPDPEARIKLKKLYPSISL